MSTVSVPPMLTSPRDDAIQLYRAFKGMLCLPSPLFFLYTIFAMYKLYAKLQSTLVLLVFCFFFL